MLKNISAKILKKAAERAVTCATASFCSCGVEKMPESMKKAR